MKKPQQADREIYRGYEIVLENFGWDSQFIVLQNGAECGRFDSRSEARNYIDNELA